MPTTPCTPNSPYTPNILHAAYTLSPNTACTLHEGVHAGDPPLLVVWEEEVVEDPGDTGGGGGGGEGGGGEGAFSGREAASESPPRLDLQERRGGGGRRGGGRLRGESALCIEARRISVRMQILRFLDLGMSGVSERQFQEDMLEKCHQAHLILPACELRAPGTPLFWHLDQE